MNRMNYNIKMTVTLFIIAIVAAIFGFTGISEAASGIGRIFFYILSAIYTSTYIRKKSTVNNMSIINKNP